MCNYLKLIHEETKQNNGETRRKSVNKDYYEKFELVGVFNSYFCDPLKWKTMTYARCSPEQKKNLHCETARRTTRQMINVFHIFTMGTALLSGEWARKWNFPLMYIYVFCEAIILDHHQQRCDTYIDLSLKTKHVVS